MENFQTKLVGVSFGDCQRNIKFLGNPGINEFDVNREPENQHDPNAIWIGFGKYKLGYKETIWLDGHFTKIYKTRKKTDKEDSWASVVKYMMEPFETWDDFIYDMTLNDRIKTLDQESKMKSIWNEYKEDNVCPV